MQQRHALRGKTNLKVPLQRNKAAKCLFSCVYVRDSRRAHVKKMWSATTTIILLFSFKNT